MRMWFSISSSLDEAQISAGHAALEVGDFLGALVDEQDHDVALGMIFEDAEGDVAEEGGLAGAGRGDDEAARAFADGAEEIDDARGHAAVLHLQLEHAGSGVMVVSVVKSNCAAALLEVARRRPSR